MPIFQQSLLSALQHNVTENPNAIAMRYLRSGSIDGEIHQWCYSDLHNRANAIACMLDQRQLAGQRVLLQYDHGLEFIAALVACFYSKAIPVPVYPPTRVDVKQSIPRLAGIYADAQASAILCSRVQYDLMTNTDLTNVPTTATPQNITDTWLISDDMTEYTADDSDIAKWFEDERKPEDLAFLQYTSGSTGNPKGVMISHANIAANLLALDQSFGFPENHNLVCWLPYHHDMGLIGNVLYSLYRGVPVTYMSPSHFIKNPINWLKAISHYKATMTTAPDFAYRHVAAMVERRGLAETIDLSCLEVAGNGSEPISADTFDLFKQALSSHGLRDDAFFPSFGMAESTLLITTKAKGTMPNTAMFNKIKLTEGIAVADDQSDAKYMVSCGPAVPDHQIIIVDPVSLDVMPDGSIGELCIRGPSVTQGYWNKEEANAALFAKVEKDSQAFLRTGDHGFMINNELFFTGRMKDLIIVRGKNHAPQDIEHTVSAIEDVRGGCVIAFSVDSSHFGTTGDGEKLVIVAERYKRGVTDDVLMEQTCREISATHGLEVSAMVLIERRTIPKTTSGKLGRAACRTAFLNDKLTVIAQFEKVAGQHKLQAQTRHQGEATQGTNDNNQQKSQSFSIDAIREHIVAFLNLSVDQLSDDQAFNELGIDSFRLIQLTQHLEGIFALELDTQVLYTYPNLAMLVNYLNGNSVTLSKVNDHSVNDESYLDDRHLVDGLTWHSSLSMNTQSTPDENGDAQLFLTGVTGFLGAFLLRDLLAETTARVICLVRANNDDDAFLRIEKNMKRYQLWHESMRARIGVVVGDLSLPQFGLNCSDFEKLSRTIDTIYHNGAALDFNKGYKALRAINVLGTLEIIKLATRSKSIPVHHVSTISVFDSSSHYGGCVNEADVPDHKDIFLGYSQSKWVAEQLVLEAGKKGLPTTVMRVGVVTGDSQQGTWNTDDIVCRLLKGSALLGCFPALNISIDLTPVDYVSRSLVKLSLDVDKQSKNKKESQVYHLNNPSSITWHKLMSWMNFYGYHMEQVNYDVWLQKIKNQSIETLNPLMPLVPYLGNIRKGGKTVIELLAVKPKINNSETVRALTSNALFQECPKVDADLLEKYFQYYHECSFLASPDGQYEAQYNDVNETSLEES